MKNARSELAPFCGQCIELIGTFCNFYHYISYRYDEKINNMVPEKSVSYNPSTGLTPVLYFVDPEKCPELKKGLIFIDKGSVISGVEIVNTDIALDHMILQCNIEKTYNVRLNSKVWIYGRIGAYTANNKEGGYDYCVAEIINLSVL